ncbi:MAG: polysaccharide biosynthesis tyrosine autokinase [Cyanobacteria bacterium P01_F01_bin.86]
MVAQQAGGESRQGPEYIEEIDFQKYWLVLKRRWIPAFLVFSTAVGLALLAALSEDSVYKAEGKVLIKRDRSSSLTGLDQEDLGRIERLSQEPLQTQAELVRSLPVMRSTVEALDLKNDNGDPVKPSSLLRKVSVKPVTGTDVLLISVESEDAEEAALIVNQVIESYREQNIADNREEAAAARQFIEEQLPATEAEVQVVEAELRRFKENNNVIFLEEEAEQAVEVLGTLDRQMNQVEAELADVNAQLGELQGQLGIDVPQAISLASLNQSEGVQSALQELQAAQSDVANLRSRYQETHPELEIQRRREAEAEALLRNRIQELVGSDLAGTGLGSLQLGELRQSLMADLTRLEIARTGLADRQAQLVTTRTNYLQQLEDLPGLEKTQRQLERQLQAAQTTYETLLTQLQEIRVVENQTVGNVRVVSFAEVPTNSLGPSRKLYLAAGGFVGFLLAIAVAFLLDLLDSSVKTVKEIKELYGYTLLGVLPLVKGPVQRGDGTMADPAYPRLLVDQPAHAGVREAYQILQANLKFLQSDTELKTVVITSAIPGEGKSEVSANLAAALAQVGRRVLLVDADMRFPRQHHALKILNGNGLSHVITGQAHVEDAIQSVAENLDVLTAGAVPPNPVALLDSNRMESLLQTFAQAYDMVIVDAPPLVGYADASILGKMADGILLIVRPGVVDYAQGRTAKDTLIQSNQKVLGMVANGINPANEPDGHFYYFRQGKSYQGGSDRHSERSLVNKLTD